MDNETIFPEGMIFKSKREGAPDFVLGSVSFKVDEIVPFLQKHESNGWVNVDFLRGKPKVEGEKGKAYFKLNTWKPENKDVATGGAVEPDAVSKAQAITPEDVPF
jgi:hypothetical protein